ncbi:hypothetical protein GGI43DRAFT_411367 [Trichoderma evansii]
MPQFDMITASVHDAEANGRSIYLNPKPIIQKDAMRNLKSFSAEYCDEHSDKFESFALKTDVNPCLGWTVVDSSDIYHTFHEPMQIPLLQNERHFAIVYNYVPKGELEECSRRSVDFTTLAAPIIGR